MDPRRRQELTRYGAPAAFLAAVTIAVLLIKAGLNGGSGPATTVGLLPTTAATTTTPATTTKLVLTAPLSTTATTTETTTLGAEYYIVHRSEEHTSELQSLAYLVCRLLLEKK